LVTSEWDTLNNNWRNFGNQAIYIDYTTLDIDNITYADLNATGANVLVISCAYDPAWQYTDAEIAAIGQYVHEGHGLIVTAGTFYYAVPNNIKLATLLGMNATSPDWSEGTTDLLDLLNSSHPLFAGVPNPYTMPEVGTAVPPEGVWSSDELAGGTYVAMGYFNESAIVVYRGLVYISPWLEAIPDYYRFNLQILYNAMIWSKYQKPQHDLVASLQAPAFVFPNSTVLVNATVTNEGIQNESNVSFSLSIVDKTLNFNKTLSQLIPLLLSGNNYTINFLWNQTAKGVYNITAYAPPVPGESDITNNKVTVLADVMLPLIRPQIGQWALYSEYELDTSTGQQTLLDQAQFDYSQYISPYEMNVTIQIMLYEEGLIYELNEWSVVNIFNRICESGVWENDWFPGMIETNITMGSQVNVLFGSATVIGSETLLVGTKLVNCWKLSQVYNETGISYTYWYDKTDGLWIKGDAFSGSTHDIIMLNETNIPTGYTPAHELQVSLQAPNTAWLGNPCTLNATVFNLGMSNETNVKLNLMINGTIVKTLVTPQLTVNDSSTISYLWRPTIEGLYNVTAYAPPVAGENVTFDNNATIWVKVVPLKGRVLFDQTHLNYSAGMYTTWISSLQAEGFEVDTFSEGSITPSALNGYDVFVTIGANYNYTSSEIATIRAFVANGGGLLVGGGAYPDIYTNLTGFANISWSYGSSPIGVSDYIYPHEVTDGVTQVFLYPTASLISNNISAQILVRDSAFNVVLAVNWYKGGRVLAFADSLSLYDSIIVYYDNLRLATNMIAWLSEKDTTPPDITITAPTNGTLIGATSIELKWNATDAQSGIDYYSVYRNSQFVANTTAQEYNVSGLIEGTNNITIVAYDVAGNHASKSVIVIVDTTPPTLHILAPANHSYVRHVVAISVSGFDIHFSHMDLSIDNQLVASFNTGVEHTYSWNTSAEQDGVHSITLVGYDQVGNSANVSITVTVDNTPPVASILSPKNASYVCRNIDVTFIAQSIALKNASITIGDEYKNVTGMNSVPFDTTQLVDGVYTVKLLVYDLAGNEAEASIMITIDNTKPIAHISYPANNSYVRGIVNLNFTFADSNLENASLLLDDQFLANVTSVTSYAWNTATTTDGSHRLTLLVSDKAGNVETVEATVIVDNRPPSGGILAPSSGTYVRGTINVTCYGNDVNLEQTILFIDGYVPLYNWTTSGTHATAWDTTKYSDGTHTIWLMIYDKAGNEFVTTTSVTVDNTPPSVSINFPSKNGTSLTGTVNINYTATDNNQIATLILMIDNMQTKIYPNQTSYQWDTTKLADGNHTIRIIATDMAGNTKEATITVKTVNAPPVYMAYIGYAIAAALGLALGSLAVWSLPKRKPTHGTKKPPTPTASTT
jgi:hypothetical protein